MNKNYEKLVEALIFAHGDPISKKKIAKITGKTKEEVGKIVSNIKNSFENERGLRIIEKDEKVQMVTAPEASSFVKNLFRSEHKEELSRAGLEVMAIIAYAGPITRAEIETIRGVNSSYTIRGLMIRGLIELETKDGFLYYDLSLKALQEFGFEKREDFPEWGSIRREIEKVKNVLTGSDERNS